MNSLNNIPKIIKNIYINIKSTIEFEGKIKSTVEMTRNVKTLSQPFGQGN